MNLRGFILGFVTSTSIFTTGYLSSIYFNPPAPIKLKCPKETVISHHFHDYTICEYVRKEQRPVGRKFLTHVETPQSWNEKISSLLTLNTLETRSRQRHSTDGRASQY
jgi:hypothetical protein